MLFNFQGPYDPRKTYPFFGDSLIIVSPHYPFVKNFFYFFINFFQMGAEARCDAEKRAF